MRRADLAIAICIGLWPAAGSCQQPGDGMAIRPDDERRLAEYHAAAGKALLEAFSGGDAADLTILAEVLKEDALPPDDALAILPGEWSCRTIKMGRLLPIVVYQPFRCRTGPDGSLEKLTGSQRTRGTIYRDGDRLVYLGTGFVAGDDPPPYADLPPFSATADPQRVPEVGLVEITGPNRGRVMFPDPHLESRFNILVLSR